jgi:hypothetical protein
MPRALGSSPSTGKASKKAKERERGKKKKEGREA